MMEVGQIAPSECCYNIYCIWTITCTLLVKLFLVFACLLRAHAYLFHNTKPLEPKNNVLFLNFVFVF